MKWFVPFNAGFFTGVVIGAFWGAVFSMMLFCGG